MRTTTKRAIRIFGLAIALSVSIAACGGGGAKDSGLTGTVNGDGSSTVFPITEAVAEEFRRDNGGVDVTVGVSGTGGGFKKFCNGETDIQDASRPIKAEEKAACAAKGIEYVELAVANDGLAVVANPKNGWATCLTVSELKKIWSPDLAVTSWKQVRAGFPDVSLKLYGPGTESGTFDYFTKEINGEEGASRSDYTSSENDNELVTGVEGDKGALGYFGFAYYQENKDQLKILGVDGGAGCVTPSDETVKANTYAPLSRPLFLYVKTTPAPRAEVVAFVDFYLDAVTTLVGDVGYTPLDDAVLQREVDEWKAASGA